MDLKNTLKTLKLNEPTISTVLGAIVVLALGIGMVNYFRARNVTTPSTVPAEQTEQKATTTPGKHTVARGEDLWKISEKYYKSGYNWVDIAKANNLSNPSVIAVGQELTLPEVAAKAADTANAAQTKPDTAVAPTTDQSITGETYKVVKGDHLWSIAVRAYGDGYKWVEIAKANKLTHPNLIYPDQQLSLPKKE